MPNKILITGAKGQLGSDLVKCFNKKYELINPDVEELDITDRGNVENFFRQAKPEITIHAAAMTDVEKCEIDADLAEKVNFDGTKNIADSCARHGCRLIAYSTDYVFDGTKTDPYIETDIPNPLNNYGKSKLMAEKYIEKNLTQFTIIRTAWLFGINGQNFIKKIIGYAKNANDDIIMVVDDQIGNPTWSFNVAEQTKKILESDNDINGIFHCCSQSSISWYGLAVEINILLDLHLNIMPCASGNYAQKARRPLNSSFENKRLKDSGLNIMPDYNNALRGFIYKHGEELLL